MKRNRVYTSEDSVWTRNRGCADLLIGLLLVVVLGMIAVVLTV